VQERPVNGDVRRVGYCFWKCSDVCSIGIIFTSAAAVHVPGGKFSTCIIQSLFAFLYYKPLQWSDSLPPKDEYSLDERQAAAESLAVIMLRIRDGKTRGMRSNGILMQLTKELVQSSKVDGMFTQL
jgi:hypothetical protein